MVKTNKNILIILAAGDGKRMHSSLPKPIQEIAGLPLIGHILNNLDISNYYKVVIVISHPKSPIKEFCQNIDNHIFFAIQTIKNGTAGAIKEAINILSDDEIKSSVLTITCADTPFLTDTTIENLQKSLASDNDMAVLGFTSKNPFGYGRLITKNNNFLLAIKEETELNDDEKKISLCNSGILSIKGEILKKYIPKINNNNKQKEYYLTDIVDLCASDNCLITFVTTNENEVIGINNLKQLAIAEGIFQEKLRNKFMVSGVKLVAPDFCFFSYDTKIDKGTIIEPFCYFKTNVTIGKNCIIHSHCYFEGCDIDDNSLIGPYARLRPNVKIGQHVKIGNFVECKNLHIAQGSKINHLAYIGDAKVGKHVNIGAGTITCNYNGKEKNSTSIENNVMIGSNVSLIAPISIKNNAYIAAGSVITKEVPSYNLGITRASQKNINDWVRKFFKNKKDK